MLTGISLKSKYLEIRHLRNITYTNIHHMDLSGEYPIWFTLCFQQLRILAC